MSIRFLFVFLLFITPVAAADFDLGRVNFPDPVIKVTYDEPVQILDAQTNLIFLNTNTGIGLSYDPAADDQFANEFEISPSAGELAEGDYSFEVVARSTLGLTNTIPETVEFSVTGLKAMLLSPASGYAQTTPYDVELLTFVYGEDEEIIPFNAKCKYFLGQNPPNNFEHGSLTPMQASNPSDDPNQYAGSGVGTKHTIQDLETTSSTLSVLCQRYKTSGDVVPRILTQQFPIGTITQGPELDISVTPTTVFNEQNPSTSIVIDTNQETFCEISDDEQIHSFAQANQGDFDTYQNQHVDFIRYDNDEGINELITSSERQERDYTITCTNLAGLSTQEEITIVIDYDATIEISVIEPPQLTNADPVIVSVQTNIFADCEIDDSFMNQDGTIHTRQVTTSDSDDYSTTITCTQEEKSTTITHNFTTDRIAPTNIQINASENICGETTTAFFEAEDNDQIHGYNWTLKDGDTIIDQGYSTNGQVEVIIPEFTSNELTWEVDARDRAGNTAPANPVTVTVAELDSDICNPGPFIQYEEPPLGADTESFTPTIRTKREATCGSRLNIPGIEPEEGSVEDASSENGLIHTLPLTINANQEVLIRCVEEDSTTHNKVLDFSIITQQPKIIQLEANPNPVNDFQSRETTITATTSTETVCQLLKDETTTFDGEDLADENTYTTSHEHTLDLSSITNQESQILDYVVSCTDKAGQTITKPLPITVDFSNTEIEVLSPQNYTNNPQPDVIVKPSATSICEYRDPDSGISGNYNQMTADSEGVHTAGLLVTLDEGAHSILVRCKNSLGDLSLKTISFIVDTTEPVMNLTGNDFVCKDASTTIEFGITDDSPVTTQVTIEGNTTNTTADRYELESTPHNESVTIEFTPIDAAGNTGSSETTTITVHEKDDLTCTNPAICGDGTVHETEECDDGNLEPGDGCSNTCTVEPDVNGTNESATCGNGVVETGEECDGSDLPLSSCQLYDPELTGTIESCNADCTYDTSTCDGVLSGPEPEPEPRPTEEPETDSENDQTPAEIEEGFPWFALILIILGTMLMGGSGYYLYMAHETKPKTQAKNPPPMTQQMQQQNTMSLEEQKRREQEKLEAFRQKEQEREAKREKIMSSFEDPEEKQEGTTQDTKQNNKQEKNSTKKTETDTSDSPKKSDVFDKLDDLVDETKGGK